MEAKEKAIELVNKYLQIYDGRVIQGKQCALIAVDEIIYYLEITLGVDKEDFEYWQEVRNEIENL